MVLPEILSRRPERACICCRAGLTLVPNAFSVFALFGLTLPVLLVDFYHNHQGMTDVSIS